MSDSKKDADTAVFTPQPKAQPKSSGEQPKERPSGGGSSKKTVGG